MDFSKLCINCMKERDSEDQKICPHCHYDQSRYTPDLFTLKPYEVLNGRYLVGRVLGKGGFGITYIAMDMILERVVAIKEFFVQGYMYRDNSNSTSISISTTSGASEEEYYRINREKFEKEAKIIASLDDLPGIVKVYDFFYENETVYMVLEYLNGINFKEYTRKKGGRLPYKEVLSKTMAVMKSLQRLHENGIIHRDISPDNIMVMDTGTVKLLDFGGAKIQANTALSSMVIAKKGYTPIEQYHTDGNQGPWTDVYAMAATIYYCICGQVPEESINRVENDNLKKPSELGIDISPEVEKVLFKALSIRSRDRYQTMAEFYTALVKAEETGKPKKTVSSQETVLYRKDEQDKTGKGRPAQSQSVQNRGTGSRSAQSQQVQNRGAGSRSAQSQATGTGPVQNRSAGTQPGQNQSGQHRPGQNSQASVQPGINQPTNKKSKSSGKKWLIGGAVAAAVIVAAVGGISTGVKKNTPVIAAESLPEILDRNTVFTKEKPLVISGTNLSKVDSLYIDNKKVKDLKIVGKTDNEVKVAFDLSGQETGNISIQLGSHFLGKFSAESEKATIKTYLSDSEIPVVDKVYKNGLDIKSKTVRIREPFNLKLTGKNISEKSKVFINGRKADNVTYQNKKLVVSVDQKCVESINEEKVMKIQLGYETVEGYDGIEKSDTTEIKTGDMVIANTWLDKIKDDTPLIMELTLWNAEKYDSKEVENEINTLYDQGIRVVSYTSAYKAKLEDVINAVKKKKGMYLILDMSIDNMQNIYDTVVKNAGGTPMMEKIVGNVYSPDMLVRWNAINREQNELQILYEADFAYETYLDTLDYWKTNNIKAVRFSNSYWKYTSVRNRKEVKDAGITFIAKTYEMMDAYKYLHPEDFTDNKVTGVKAVMTGSFNTPDEIKEEMEEGSVGTARKLTALKNGSSMEDYVNILDKSDFTMLIALRDDTTEYITAVKLSKYNDEPEVLLEESELSSEKKSIEAECELSWGSVKAHLKSSPSGAVISFDGKNYAANKKGFNIVIYDDVDQTIIDSFWYPLDADMTTLSKNGTLEWKKCVSSETKGYKKEYIINDLESLAESGNDQLIMIATAGDVTANMDKDIQAALAKLGVQAAFDDKKNSGKSYLGIFTPDGETVNVNGGKNDAFSAEKVWVDDFEYDNKKFKIVSEGSGIGNSLPQIKIDGREITNRLRGIHIVLYDKTTHKPKRYLWIDGSNSLNHETIYLN